MALDVKSPMDLVYECFSKLGLRYICVLRDGKYAGMVSREMKSQRLRWQLIMSTDAQEDICQVHEGTGGGAVVNPTNQLYLSQIASTTTKMTPYTRIIDVRVQEDAAQRNRWATERPNGSSLSIVGRFIFALSTAFYFYSVCYRPVCTCSALGSFFFMN